MAKERATKDETADTPKITARAAEEAYRHAAAPFAGAVFKG
jgi:hypothetical protein